MDNKQKLAAWELVLDQFPILFNRTFNRDGGYHSLRTDCLCALFMQMHKMKLIDFQIRLYLQSTIDMHSVELRSKNSLGYMWPPEEQKQRLEFIQQNINKLKLQFYDLYEKSGS